MEENSKAYISTSKQNIDSFMRNNEYIKAFGLFIAIEKNEFINYYSNKYFSMMY